MKEKIYNDYHIIATEIIKINANLFKIKADEGQFYYQQCDITEDSLKKIEHLCKLLHDNNQIKSHRLVFTINKRIINDGYVLLECSNSEKVTIGIDEIINFNDKKYYINNYEMDWSIEWERIIDKIEQKVITINYNDPEVLVLITFFIGLAENAILLYRQSIGKVKKYFVPSHRRISDNYYSFYNPLLYDWNYEEYDLSEYLKLLLLDDKFSIDDINYIKVIKKWDKNEWTVFFSNILFCNRFFSELLDAFENNSVDEIKKYYAVVNNYYDSIKKISRSLSLFIPNIFWIES